MPIYQIIENESKSRDLDPIRLSSKPGPNCPGELATFETGTHLD